MGEESGDRSIRKFPRLGSETMKASWHVHITQAACQAKVCSCLPENHARDPGYTYVNVDVTAIHACTEYAEQHGKYSSANEPC